MIEDIEKLKLLRSSGQWWKREWWRDPTYQKDIGLEAAEIEAAFEAVRGVFDDAWAQKQEGSGHSMVDELFCRGGLSPLTFLCKLGSDLISLRSAGQLGDLPRRLRDREEFDSASAELDALAHWISAGIKVQRNVPSGNGNRNCDWMVSDGDSVIYGEVKKLDAAPVNKRPEAPWVPPWERKPIRIDLSAEGDKAMDVIEENAAQLPECGPGVFMLVGRGSAAAIPFSAETGNRMIERFRMPSSPCGHIAGVLFMRSWLVPENGLVKTVMFVRNPVGPSLDMDLLKRGFPSLEIWTAPRTPAGPGPRNIRSSGQGSAGQEE